MATNAAPIIIKRKKKGGHGDGHHGGAWKVAYADFVTAMMAFFLLLWLLSSTTQEQRSGISNYFSNASVARTTSGAGGVLGDQTITLDGPQRGKGAPLGLPTPMPTRTVTAPKRRAARTASMQGPATSARKTPTTTARPTTRRARSAKARIRPARNRAASPA